MPNAIARGSKRTAKVLQNFELTKFFSEKNRFLQKNKKFPHYKMQIL